MSLFINFLVHRNGDGAGRMAWDYSHCSEVLIDELANEIGIIRHIRQYILGLRQALQDRFCKTAVVDLPTTDFKPQRVSQSINASMDFTGQPAF